MRDVAAARDRPPEPRVVVLGHLPALSQIRGAEPVVIPAQPGQAISLSLNVPPDNGYSSYKLDLYSSQGALEWSRSIPASGNDALSLLIPPAGHRPSTLMVYGVTAGGESVNLGRFRIELQNQK